MKNKKNKVRYPFSRFLLAGALPRFIERYQQNVFPESTFDVYLVELAAADGAGIRGRIIIRGLKSYCIQYESLAVPDPFGDWLINLKK